MGLIDTVKNHLPGIRRPERSSLVDVFMNEYWWSFTTPDKHIGDLRTYYDAYDNCVWVRRCCGVICDEILSTGYQINNPNKEQVNFEKVNYLTDLFNAPGGKYADDTFSSFIKQIVPSWKVTGDAFIEVNHDKLFGNVPNGFRFIPTELMGYDYERGAWCLRNTEHVFEPENLIHIYEPKITIRGSKWGTSLIDTASMDIALEVLGLGHNKDIFSNHGLDPRGVLNFDKDISSNIVKGNIARFKKEKDKKGMIITQGANYQATNNSNRDMEFLALLQYARDRIITMFCFLFAKVGILVTGNIGTGTGESQDKNFGKVINGDCRVIEDAFNKNLGRSGFQELFEFIREDHENKLNRADIEDKQLRNGTTFINEVRSGYGLPPVEWGNVPMNYSQFALAASPEAIQDSTLIQPSEPNVKMLEKALLVERYGKEYGF
ncbi:phage portal protein [Methanobrevibacter ruminantium]|uniref:phage portal protein n=1 Tax=Methanobrevibacter ruminantium TaxID=83816 RepID=UPI0026F33333|nr:phage portal protein [Methanobrevibacter ruminantium]